MVLQTPSNEGNYVIRKIAKKNTRCGYQTVARNNSCLKSRLYPTLGDTAGNVSWDFE